MDEIDLIIVNKLIKEALAPIKDKIQKLEDRLENKDQTEKSQPQHDWDITVGHKKEQEKNNGQKR